MCLKSANHGQLYNDENYSKNLYFMPIEYLRLSNTYTRVQLAAGSSVEVPHSAKV